MGVSAISRKSAISNPFSMKQRAAYAIASMIPDEELNAENIIPSPLNKGVAAVVAKAVADTAVEEGIARI